MSRFQTSTGIPTADAQAFAEADARRWEASEYMEFAHGFTIAKLASIGGGPGFHRVGRMPLYPRDELDRWATEKLGRVVRSTSEII